MCNSSLTPLEIQVMAKSETGHWLSSIEWVKSNWRYIQQIVKWEGTIIMLDCGKYLGTVKHAHVFMSIKQSSIKTIWIEPLLKGHLSYEAMFSFSKRWPLKTGLTVV